MIVNHRKKWPVWLRLQRTSWRSYSSIFYPPLTPAMIPKITGYIYLPFTTALQHVPPSLRGYCPTPLQSSRFSDSISPYFTLKLSCIAGLCDKLHRGWMNLPCCISSFFLANTPHMASSGILYPSTPFL
jgi:hypothetical protein